MSFSTTLLIRTSDYLRYLRIKRTLPWLWNCPPHLINVTTLPCEMQNLFIWVKICCFPSNVGGSKKSRLYVWQVECQPSKFVTATVKTSKWPPSVWTHASSLFRHRSIASSTTLYWNSAHVSSRCHNSSVSRIDTLLHYAPDAVIYRIWIRTVGWLHVRTD